MTDLPTSPVVVQIPPKSRAWAIAAVVMTLLLLVGVPVGYVVITWSHAVVTAPGRLADTISQAAADALRPKVTVHEIVLSSINDLHKESKLVVFTADVSTDITRQEASSSWGMYWGTNVARVAVKNARVQYVMDLNQISTADFVYNEDAKVLAVSLPRPRVDKTMVNIDPGSIQTLDLRGGWARWDKQDTRAQALADLRPMVIAQASKPFVHELADAQGMDAATRLLQPVAHAVSKDGVTLRVSYRD
jgi:hypothetical protein